MPHDLVLVCAGADAARAKETHMPLLHLCLGLRPNGGLDRLTLSTQQPGCYLGVTDLGLAQNVSTGVCEQLLAEVKRVQAVGIFADMERDSPPVRQFLHTLDTLAEKAGCKIFVPLAQADQVHHAHLVVETALSGGSLAERFQTLQRAYPNRIAASLHPISRDFCLPAQDTEGTPLTTVQRQALQEKTGAQAFFSRELCARYFTYMDEKQNGHFVLFDDDNTLLAKLDFLQSIGVSPIFAVYPEVKQLFHL